MRKTVANYNSRFVYVLPTFWRQFLCVHVIFWKLSLTFVNIQERLVIKSGLWWCIILKLSIYNLYISDTFESNIEINIKDQKLIQRENLAMPKDRCHHFPPSFSVNSHMGSLCSPLRTDKIQSFSVCKFRNVRTKLFGLKIFEGSLPKQIQPRNGILLPSLFWPTVRKKCYSYREKLLKFQSEGWEFAKFLRSLE